MQIAGNALPKNAQPSYYRLNPRLRLVDDMSTPTTESASGSGLSTGAIVGIVIGSIFGAVVLIGVVFLVRHFFCRFPSSQSSSDKFAVSYTRSDLNSSTLDRTALSSVGPESNGTAGFGGDAEMAPSVTLPRFKSSGEEQDSPDGNESGVAIEINFPDRSECLNQKKGDDFLPSKSSKIGTDNPCFDPKDDPLFLSTVPTKSLTVMTPTIALSQPNSNCNIRPSSDSKLNISYAQQRSNMIRRSYHLDRKVASAIAAQRNREMTAAAAIFNTSEVPANSNDDVIIVFTARTVL